MRGPKNAKQNLRVREHPKEGPYVQGNNMSLSFLRINLTFGLLLLADGKYVKSPKITNVAKIAIACIYRSQVVENNKLLKHFLA